MRIRRDKVNLDSEEIKDFFERRGKKYDAENPYVTTMYQDKNPDLAIARNRAEVNFILPLLQLTSSSRVLDIACGIGRWADALSPLPAFYAGVDFSEELVRIAQKRCSLKNFTFHCSSSNDLYSLYEQNNWIPFDRIIISGLCPYLNDTDLCYLFTTLPKITECSNRIYIRHSCGVTERLTLKNEESDELNDKYSSIYRTPEEYNEYYSECFDRYRVICDGWLFDNSSHLNNRNETSQYYWMIEINV